MSVEAQEKEETEGDRLLSSVQALEGEMACFQSPDSKTPVKSKQSMPSTSPSTPRRSPDPPGRPLEISASASGTVSETPTKPLLDKFDSLSNNWSSVRSVGSSKKSLPSRIVAPSVTYNAGSPHDSKTPRRRSRLSTTPVRQSPARRLHLQQQQQQHTDQEELDNDDDLHSVGESTISTMSSGSESVFDRLYRLGVESEQKKKVRRRQALATPTQHASPASSGPAFFGSPEPVARPLSYTPKSTGRLPPPPKTPVWSGSSVASNSQSARKNRLAVITESQSVASYRRRRQSTNSISTPRFSGSQSVRSVATPDVTSRRRHSSAHQQPPQGNARISTPKATPTTQRQMQQQTPPSPSSSVHSTPSTPRDGDVFSRLYRNEKRATPLWKQPANFVPAKRSETKTPAKTSTPSSTCSTTKASRTTGAKPNLHVDVGSPKPYPSIPCDPSPTPTTSLTPTTVDEDFQLLEELLGDDTPKGMTTTIVQPMPEEHDFSTDATTTALKGENLLPTAEDKNESRDSIDDDLEELQKIQQTLSSSSKNSPTFMTPMATLEAAMEWSDSDSELVSSPESVRRMDRSQAMKSGTRRLNISVDSVDQTLDAVLEATSSSSSSSRVSPTNIPPAKPSSSHALLHTGTSDTPNRPEQDSIDQDLAELASIGQYVQDVLEPSLSKDASQPQPNDIDPSIPLSEDERGFSPVSESSASASSGFFTLDDTSGCLRGEQWTMNDDLCKTKPLPRKRNSQSPQSNTNTLVAPKIQYKPPTPKSNTLPDVSPELRQIAIQNRAAAAVQNWFRLHVLKSALQSSADTREELQKTLEPISKQGHVPPRSLEAARVLLGDSSRLEHWLDPVDPNPSAFRRWNCTSGDPTKAWLERRAATLAIHNIVKAYLMGLRRFRRNQKAVQIQAAWRRRSVQRRSPELTEVSKSLSKSVNGQKKEFDLERLVVRIQSLWRGKRLRFAWQTLRFTATVIQSAWRQSHLRKQYLARCQVALWSQKIWRGSQARKYFEKRQMDVQREKELCDTATKIQTWGRKVLAQQMWHQLLRSVLLLQTRYRRWAQLSSYKKTRFGTIKVQSMWRRKLVHQQFLHSKSAIVRIQSFGRYCIAQRRFFLAKYLCKWVQRHFRGVQGRKKASQMKAMSNAQLSGVLVIQGFVRRVVLPAVTREREASAIRIQKQFRGLVAREQHSKTLHRRNVSVVRLQSASRGMLARTQYDQCRGSSIILQSVIRGFVCRKRLATLSKDRAARKIQSVIRRHQAVFMLETHRYAATAFQSAWRGFQTRKEIQLIVAASILIQSHWRRRLACQRVSHLVFGLLSIQAFTRGMIQQKKFDTLKKHAVFLQSKFRSAHARQQFMFARASATMIQATVRGHQYRLSYCEMMENVVRVQGIVRGFKARKVSYRVSTAATRLQAHMRGWISRIASHRNTKASSTIQCYWRRAVARSNYLHEKAVVIMIQATTRSFLLRRKSLKCSAAVRIQTCWRRHWYEVNYIRRMERKRLYQEARRTKESNSARIIQTKYRQYHMKLQLEFLRNGSAVTMQRIWRGAHARDVYTTARAAIIMIQAQMRLSMARRHVSQKLELKRLDQEEQQEKASQLIQNYYRQWKQHCKEVNAATLIQSCWRSSVAFHRRLFVLRGVRALQAVVRRHQALFLFQKQRYAATSFQAIWRGKEARLEFERKRAAAMMIQSLVRGIQSYQNFMICRASATMIQATARGCICREHFRVLFECAVEVQRMIRGHQARSSCYRRFHAVLTIQSAARRVIALRNIKRQQSLREELERNARAATTLQAFFRGVVCRSDYVRQTEAACRIQSYWRRAITRERYLASKVAVSMIQAQMRSFLARQQLARIKTAIRIQAVWRSFWHQKLFARRVERRRLYQEARQSRAARTIQFQYRSYRSWVRHVAKEHSAAISLQRHWRGTTAREHYTNARAAATMIQATMRSKLTRQNLELSSLASLRIQSSWRAFSCRRQFIQKIVLKHLYQEARRTKAARKIQETHRNWKRYCAANEAATMIQRNWRSVVALRQRLLVLNGVCAFQAATRRNQAVFHFQKQRYAATSFQAVWRGKEARLEFERKRAAAMMIQSLMRGLLARQHNREMSIAAMKIQRAWSMPRRLHYAGGVVALKLSSILMIQRWWRAIRDRRLYLSQRWSAKRIQATARTYLASKSRMNGSSYTLVLASRGIIKLQALYRAKKARSQYWYVMASPEVRATLDEAVRKIQFCYFLWKMRLAVWEMESSAVILQRTIRGQLARPAARYALFHMNSSIQAAPLSPMMRTAPASGASTRPTLATWERAVSLAKVTSSIVIQSAVRRMLARKLVQTNFGVSFSNCLHKKGTQQRENEAASKVQRAVRLWMKRRLSAACQLQSVARCLLSIKEYDRLPQEHPTQKERSAICILQCLARRLLAQKEYAKLLQEQRAKKEIAAASLLQCVARHVIAQKEYSNLRRKQEAACLLQCVARRALAQKLVANLRHEQRVKEESTAACLLQCLARRTLAVQEYHDLRKQNAAKKQNTAACLLQGLARRALAKKEYSNLLRVSKAKREHKAACVLQCFARRVLAQMEETAKKQHEAACLLQCLARRALAQKEYTNLFQKYTAKKEHDAACLLQCLARSILAQKEYTNLLHQRTSQKQYAAACLLQCLARRVLAQKEYTSLLHKQTAQKQNEAACLLQCLARRALAQKEYANLFQKYKAKKEHDAACLLQCLARSILAQKEYINLLRKRTSQKQYAAACLLQCLARRVLVQKEYTTLLQKHTAQKQNEAACLLQCLARRVLAQKEYTILLQKHTAQKQNEAASLLQCLARRILAQKEYTSLLQNQTAKKEHDAACSLQRMARRVLALKEYAKHIQNQVAREETENGILLQGLENRLQQESESFTKELMLEPDAVAMMPPCLDRLRARVQSAEAYYKSCCEVPDVLVELESFMKGYKGFLTTSVSASSPQNEFPCGERKVATPVRSNKTFESFCKYESEGDIPSPIQVEKDWDWTGQW